MVHFFDDDVAVEVGLNGAIILNHLHYWLKKNADNEMNYHDGYYWTYNSVAAFRKQFPFWSEKTIGRILKDLENEGYIKTGNYNPSTYDRTKWYALTEKSIKLLASPIVQEYEPQKAANADRNALGQNGDMQDDNLSNRTMTHCPNEITQSESFHLDNVSKSTINKNIHKEIQQREEGGSGRQNDVVVVSENLCDEELAEINKTYEQEICIAPPPSHYKMLAEFKDEYGKEHVLQAIKTASFNGARKLSYIKGILDNWKKEGVPKPWEKDSKPKKELSATEFMEQEKRRRKEQEERDNRLAALIRQREKERENG